MFVESRNDEYKGWRQVATQEDFRQVLIISLPVTASGEKCIIVLLSRGENIMYRKGKSYRKSSLIKSRRRQQSQFWTSNVYATGKLQNRIWEFTIGDADDHPSIPHAHARGSGERLNAWTGEIYQAGNDRVKIIGKLKKKELSRLHSDPRFIEFARNQIDWYRNTYPHITFDVPDWFETKCRLSCLSMKRDENEITDFSFCRKSKF